MLYLACWKNEMGYTIREMTVLILNRKGKLGSEFEDASNLYQSL